MLNVLVTRPEQQAKLTARKLRKLGFNPIIKPLTQIIEKKTDLPQGVFDAVIITSGAALRYLPHGQFNDLLATKLYCVGKQTAKSARQYGFCQIFAVYRDSVDLLESMQLAPRSRILYLTGEVRNPQIEEYLQARNHTVTAVETYHTVNLNVNPQDIDWFSLDAILIYSQFSAKIISDFAIHFAANTKLICLSPRIAACLNEKPPNNVIVAAEPNERSLFQQLSELAKQTK